MELLELEIKWFNILGPDYYTIADHGLDHGLVGPHGHLWAGAPKLAHGFPDIEEKAFCLFND